MNIDDEEARYRRIDELLDLFNIEPIRHRKGVSLSGGERRRVEIARALVNAPKFLLLDEPFAHIDEFRRSRLRRLLYSYLKQKGITCITATHDANEALSFADFILILEEGGVSFYGKPQELYQNVSSAYQAGFFGEINEIPDDKGGFKYLFPHQLIISEKEADLSATVKASFFKGSHYLIQASNNETDLFFTSKVPINKGEHIHLKINTNAIS